MDDILHTQITSEDRRRRLPSSSSRLARELDVEALIAISVGFPIVSLIEEEIESNVISVFGSAAQTNIIVVLSHIVALWRSNASIRLTEVAAAAAIRYEHRHLVAAAHSFLRRYAYINFGIVRSPLSLPSPSPCSSVIIVGAGFAGLGAACHLMSLGFKVVVLDGRIRPGGRVLTRKMQGAGVVEAADLGGSVLTGKNGNPLGVLARQLGLPIHKVRDKCSLHLPDGRLVDHAVDNRIEAAFSQLLEKVCKLRQAILDELKSVDVSLGEALEAFCGVYGVAEPTEERMLKRAAIEFVPPLPLQKQEAIDRLGFGLLNKVAMLFPYNFCGGGIDTFGHLTRDSSHRGEFFLFYIYCSVSGGPLLVALVAGESDIAFEKVPPTEPVERALSVLRDIFAPKGIQVPDPVPVICTHWGTDIFTYGSYSYVAVGSSGDDYDLLAESIGDGECSLLERLQTGGILPQCMELYLAVSERRLTYLGQLGGGRWCRQWIKQK